MFSEMDGFQEQIHWIIKIDGGAHFEVFNRAASEQALIWPLWHVMATS